MAVECRVNFFDTADVYGGGRSEELIGEVLGEYSSRQLFVCTKYGNRLRGPNECVKDFSPQYTRACVEGSLRRLQREAIDVLLLHNPPSDLIGSRFDTSELEKLVAEGKIRTWGVSCRSVDDAERLLQDGRACAIEVIYNVLDRRAERILAECAKRGVAVIDRVPLSSGFLSNRFLSDSIPRFSPTDIRSVIAEADVQWRLAAVRALSFLDDLEGGFSTSALRFVLSRPEVSTVIPGMRNADQVRLNARAAELGRLPETVRQRIVEAVPDIFPDWAMSCDKLPHRDRESC